MQMTIDGFVGGAEGQLGWKFLPGGLILVMNAASYSNGIVMN